MNRELSTLGKHTLIYAIGIIISKATSFIMLPIYTRYLTPADYGTLELLTMTIDVISMIAGIGLAQAVFKFYAEYDNLEDKKQVISSATIIIMTIAFTTAILGFTCSPELSRLIFGQIKNTSYFRIFFIIYFLQSTIIVPLLFIRARQNSLLFVILNSIKLFIQLSLNIYFVVILKMGVLGVLYSSLLAGFMLGSYLLIYTLRQVGFKFSPSKTKRMISFGYPLVFWSLCSFILTFSDRYFINFYTDTTSVGIYALGYKFGFLLTAFVFFPFEQIWDPQRFEIAKQTNGKDVFVKVFSYLSMVLFLISLIITLSVKDVLTVMADPSYLNAYKIVPIILLSYIFQAWTAFCNIGFFLKNKTKFYSLSGVIATGSAIVLNFILIPRYGVHGAAWATFLAFGIRFILVYALSQKYYHVNYDWPKIIMIILLASAIYAIRLLLGDLSLTISLTVALLLTLMTFVLIYILFLENSERSLIKSVWINLLSRFGLAFQQAVNQKRE